MTGECYNWEWEQMLKWICLRDEKKTTHTHRRNCNKRTDFQYIWTWSFNRFIVLVNWIERQHEVKSSSKSMENISTTYKDKKFILLLNVYEWEPFPNKSFILRVGIKSISMYWILHIYHIGLDLSHHLIYRQIETTILNLFFLLFNSQFYSEYKQVSSVIIPISVVLTNADCWRRKTTRREREKKK